MRTAKRDPERYPGDYAAAVVRFVEANPPSKGVGELAVFHAADCDHPRTGAPCRCIAEITWLPGNKTI